MPFRTSPFCSAILSGHHSTNSPQLSKRGLSAILFSPVLCQLFIISAVGTAPQSFFYYRGNDGVLLFLDPNPLAFRLKVCNVLKYNIFRFGA